MTSVVFDTGALSFFLAAHERLRAVRDRIGAGTDEGRFSRRSLSPSSTTRPVRRWGGTSRR
jgi:hypothetical protein